MNTWDKFSLFELEQISEKELLSIHPNEKGQNECQTRANIALILKDEDRLEDCPLFNEVKEYRGYFIEYLEYSPEDLAHNIYHNISPKQYIQADILTKKYRLIFVYLAYMSKLIFSQTTNKKTGRISIREIPLYYDESFRDHLHAIPIEDLKLLVNLGDRQNFNLAYGVLDKVLAESLYDEIKNPLKMIHLLYVLKLNLRVIAEKKNDEFMISFIDSNNVNVKRYRSSIYDYYPTIRNARNINIDAGNVILYALAPISSVVGGSPFYHINYEQFIETMEYLLEKSGMNCEDFIEKLSEYLVTDRAKRFLLAAKMRLCKNTMGDWISKYASLTHI